MMGEFLKDPRVVDLINRTANRLRRRPELHDQDAKDLAQDLSLGLIVRFPAMQPSDPGFMAKVVRGTQSTAASMVRDAGRQKRDRRRVTSQGNDGGWHLLAEDRRRATSDVKLIVRTRDDALAVLRRVLDGEYNVCLLLGRVNQSQAACSLGITRKQLSQKLKTIRLATAARDEEHLRNHGRTPRRNGVDEK